MQWLAQVCVRRPVFAGVLMLVIVAAVCSSAVIWAAQSLVSVNETGVPAADIGAIVISDRHSTVEVPSGKADQIVEALGAAEPGGYIVTVQEGEAAPIDSSLWMEPGWQCVVFLARDVAKWADVIKAAGIRAE